MTAAELDLTIPLRECTPWCDTGDGHSDLHPDDRACWSNPETVPMSRRRAVEYGQQGYWERDRLSVHLQRRPQEAESFVLLHHMESDVEFPFTLAEAAHLRDVLTALLDQA